MDNNNIKQVDFAGRNSHQAAVEKLKRELEIARDVLPILAEFRKAAYDEYVKSGFTPEQALILCQRA